MISKKQTLSWIIPIFLALFASSVFSANSAVVLMYHRFNENRFPSTSIRLDQFEAQLDFLQKNGYHVLPLTDIVDKLAQHQPLPEKTVAITIDDAYQSVYTQAWPRLKKAGFPFTLFVATDPIDQHFPDMMTWEEIQELAAQGVEIGNHSASHPYLEKLPLEKAQADIEKAQKRLISMLKKAPTLFAYPYGEYDLAVVQAVKKLGFKAAFVQTSGPIGEKSPPLLLSRFPLNEHYGEPKRFSQILNTLPLPVEERSPEEPLLGSNNPPVIRFKISDAGLNLSTLGCYASQVGALKITISEKNRVKAVSPVPFKSGRVHINCTLPAKNGQWYWVSWLYLV